MQVVVAVFVVGLVGAVLPSDDEAEEVAQQDTTTTVATATTTAVMSTTPTTPPDPKRQLEAALLKALRGKGSGREGVRRVEVVSAEAGLPIVVKWAIAEHITGGLTKNTARRETVDILKVIRSFTGVDWTGARLEGTYALVDQFGNESEERVFLGDYSRATIERINFDGFDFKNAWEITDEEAFVHPTFQY